MAFGVHIIRIGGFWLKGMLHPGPHIIQYLLVGLHIGRFRAHFHRHVADGHALGHAQRIHIAAGKGDGLVNRAVRLDLAHDMQYHVLGINPFGLLALDADLNDLGNAHPQFAFQ